MTKLVNRWPDNPLLRPADVKPTADDLQVVCLLNPGAFEYDGRIGLLLRVAERPRPQPDHVTTCIIDPRCPDGVRRLSYRRDDPHLACADPRSLTYRGLPLVSTLSHLRLAWSDDGRRFHVDPKPTLTGLGPHETYGVEDCRVVLLDGAYRLTYTAVSPAGVAVGMVRTTNWRSFDHEGLIFPPHNKDCALFPRTIGDRYWALHRPSGVYRGGNFIWIAQSPDLRHWGDHRCLAMTRPGKWDGARIGANGSPIETNAGWLLLYHGADAEGRYAIGAMLLDRGRPSRIIARTPEPILQPVAEYERTGFLGQVVFSNGHRVRSDEVDIYYGAADQVICGATARIDDILSAMTEDDLVGNQYHQPPNTCLAP